jgi:hypothetical protein
VISRLSRHSCIGIEENHENSLSQDVRFEVLRAVKVSMLVLCVVILRGLVGRHKRF